MLRRTYSLAAMHLLAAVGFMYFAGAFSSRGGTLSFFGHLAVAILLAGGGLVSISGKVEMPRLVRLEAYWGLGAVVIYLLVDTFIMHPPLGIFDGAGSAEQQHVSLYLMLAGLVALVLVILRYTDVLPSVHILITAAAFALVYSVHEQQTAIGLLGHNATIVFVVIAAVLRLVVRMFEYGVALVVAAHTFFGCQSGVVRFAEQFYERECQGQAPPRLDAKPFWTWHSASRWLE